MPCVYQTGECTICYETVELSELEHDPTCIDCNDAEKCLNVICNDCLRVAESIIEPSHDNND